MDKIDRKILSLLQENARYPLKYLAQKVFLSSPAVSTRIERLEKAGILTGYHATIDPVALGYHITAFINLTLDPKQKDEFYPYVKDCPNVLECNCVTGTYSIMLKVAFPSTMELDRHRLYSLLLFPQEELASQQMTLKKNNYRMLYNFSVNTV